MGSEVARRWPFFLGVRSQIHVFTGLGSDGTDFRWPVDGRLDFAKSLAEYLLDFRVFIRFLVGSLWDPCGILVGSLWVFVSFKNSRWRPYTTHGTKVNLEPF